MKCKFLVALFLLTAILPGRAQLTLVENGEPKARIIVTTDKQADREAAELLQEFVRRISDATLPIVRDDAGPSGDILIGNGPLDPSFLTDGLTEDGFLISTRDGFGRIVSGGDKGSIYGVVTLLEQYLGVNYWGENAYSLPRQTSIQLPEIYHADNPAFRYRQSQNYALQTDPVYKMWMRLEEPREVFAAGYWVHTFDNLLPSAVYGAEHPEYYAFFNGKRHPGKASQWCLTNPEVFEIVARRIDSIFRADPQRHIISVSQNDGNNTYCRCEECLEIDEYEEAPSGTMVRFMNKLAERFPDKEFSMLAYLYTMKPPKYIKPLPNVNIMLCDIDCTREVTLTENASGREFVEAMKGWSRISDNIFVWDYGINFDNYVSPFPNFHILQDNIRLFRDHNATMHFSQIAGSRGGDFAELRTWMVSKLMWNPEANADSLMQTFLTGYYGDAAPYLYRYHKIMEGALMGSGIRLWIYDSPVSHKSGMLRPELMRRYNELFDRAEEAVAEDRVLLDRVRRSRLSLQYAELDIARTEKDKDVNEIRDKLELFEERVRYFEVPTLNERRNSPLDYCELYRERYMPRTERSLAAGAKVNYLVPPSGSYGKIGETALTDELFGGATFVESWVGWEGVDGAFVIDLGEQKRISTIDTDFLHQLGQWILLPKKVTYAISADGKRFETAGVYELVEDRDPQVKFVGVVHEFDTPVTTRYVRVEVEGTNTCPEWHYGVGHPCWFFIDEVTVL